MAIYQEQIEIPRPDFAGGPHSWQLSGLSDVTVIFGKNGSGKSVLLRYWRDQNSETCHYISPERGGNIEYSPNLLSEIQTPQGRRNRSQNNFSPQYRNEVTTRVGAYFATRGAHLPKMGTSIDGRKDFHPEILAECLSRLFPDFEAEISEEPPYSKFKRVRNGENIGNVNQLSSGEAQLLSLALDIVSIVAIWVLKNQGQRLLLIDEPDAHIHPDLQLRFADFTSWLVAEYDIQVVVATHSTTLLSAFGERGDVTTSSIFLEFGKSEFRAEPFSDFRRKLVSCLGGHLLTGPLFNAPLLLVEGDDDQRIWSQVPRHHVVNFSVIGCQGEEIKRFHKNLENLFAVLMDASENFIGYALLDGDKPLPVSNPDAPQNYLKFLRMSCHEAENLFLSDEVLEDLGHTWESASQKIIERASEYGNKSDILTTADQWDRKQHNLKPIITEISKIIDEKNVDWTVRVGKRIGRERPCGQLAEFLGDEIVLAFWGEKAVLISETESSNDRSDGLAG